MYDKTAYVRENDEKQIDFKCEFRWQGNTEQIEEERSLRKIFDGL